MDGHKKNAYVFTWNNYPASAHELLQRFKFTYLVYGEEKAPETGTPHLQGFIRFTSARTIAAIQKSLKPHAFSFLEKAHCEDEPWKAIPDKYCKKDGNYHEFGTKPAQGKRTDLKNIKQLRDTNVRTLIENGTIQNYQQLKFAEALQKYAPLHHRDPPTVLWFWGNSGTGKTREAMTYPDPYINDLGQWFDGYSGQETLILDDFRPHQIKFNELLRLLDRYPRRLAVKGTSVQLEAKTIIITAPASPAALYGYTDKQWLNPKLPCWQLKRRLTEIKYFEDIEPNGVPPEEQLSSSPPSSPCSEDFQEDLYEDVPCYDCT